MSLHHALRRTVFGAIAAFTLLVAPALAADPVFPLNSRIGLVPPPGFIPSNRFIGFENPQASAAILLLAMPGDAYADMEKGFTDELFKSRGITVALREAMTLKDGKAIFVAGPKEAEGTKRYESALLANVGGITAIISMQMLEASHATITDAVVRDMFKTVTVRKEVPESEKLAVLPYKIGELAGFRIVRSGHDGTAILTLGPKDAVADVEQPFVLITVVVGELPKVEERDRIARQAFNSAPGIKDVNIFSAEHIVIGPTSGYEILAEAKDAATNVDINAVQWIRFGQNSHLQMFAIGRRNTWNDVFPKLRAIRDGMGPRGG